jgi:hypothetical protein
MKNYIIFYTCIILFVIGGIKGTSYVIEKEKAEELNKINFNKNVADLLVQGGAASREEIAGKNIVIYMLYIGSDTVKTNYLKLNGLTAKYGQNTAFYVFSRFPMQEQTDNFFRKINLQPVFKVVNKPRELANYVQGLTHYFYKKEELDEIAGRRVVPIMVVINNAGKIKLYKVGNDKDIMEQVEKAIQ